MNTNHSIWRSEVRNYELDFQRIVNNAVYLNYLDYAQAFYLKQFDFNIENAADNNINFVLVDTHLKFKRALRASEKFYVDTQLVRISKLQFLFRQKIFLDGSETLILEAESITCCVNAQTGKVCLPSELERIEIKSE